MHMDVGKGSISAEANEYLDCCFLYVIFLPSTAIFSYKCCSSQSWKFWHRINTNEVGGGYEGSDSFLVVRGNYSCL